MKFLIRTLLEHLYRRPACTSHILQLPSHALPCLAFTSPLTSTLFHCSICPSLPSFHYPHTPTAALLRYCHRGQFSRWQWVCYISTTPWTVPRHHTLSTPLVSHLSLMSCSFLHVIFSISIPIPGYSHHCSICTTLMICATYTGPPTGHLWVRCPLVPLGG